MDSGCWSNHTKRAFIGNVSHWIDCVHRLLCHPASLQFSNLWTIHFEFSSTIYWCLFHVEYIDVYIRDRFLWLLYSWKVGYTSQTLIFKTLLYDRQYPLQISTRFCRHWYVYNVTTATKGEWKYVWTSGIVTELWASNILLHCSTSIEVRSKHPRGKNPK